MEVYEFGTALSTADIESGIHCGTTTIIPKKLGRDTASYRSVFVVPSKIAHCWPKATHSPYGIV